LSWSDVRPPAANPLPDDGLEAINRLWTIARVFTNTAHQINNALQVITGNAELLASRDLDPAVRKRLETITSEAGRAAAMLNDLLTYVRGGARAPRTLDVAELANAAVAMRVASTNRRRITMTLERSDDAPFHAVLDRGRGLQALLNLLLAAEEWVQGGEKARVTLRLQRDGGVLACIRASVEAPRLEEPSPTPALTGDAEFLRAVTFDAQEWAAGVLAEAEGATLAVRSSDVEKIYELRFKGVKA
jgi:signal transduction histidine kinase